MMFTNKRNKTAKWLSLITVLTILSLSEIVYSTPITFGTVGGTPGFVEGTPQTVGNTISFATELAAVNRDLGLDQLTIESILGGYLLGGTTGAVVGGIASQILFLTTNDTATGSGTFNFAVSSDSPIITDIDVAFTGVFITEVDDFIVDFGWGTASVAGTSTYGATPTTVTFNPASDDGTSYETPTAIPFTGTAHIDLPQPTQATIFSGSVTVTASNPGATDTFSAGILQGFSATVSVVPEPSTLLLLGSGLAGIVGVGRKKLFSKL